MTPFAAFKAARTLETIPHRMDTLRTRQDRATATLGTMLGREETLTIPGYIVRRTPDGIAVQPTGSALPAGWAQLRIEE